VLYAWAPTLPAAALAIVALGGLYLSMLSGLSTVVQTHAPAALRGRIMSLQVVALSLFYAIGALAQGALADRIGLRLTTTATAALLAFALLAARLARPHLAAALRDDAPRSASDEDSSAAR